MLPATIPDPTRAKALALSSDKMPAFRVLHENGPGQTLLQLATAANKQMVAVRDALASLVQCQESFAKLGEDDVLRSFLEMGRDNETGGFGGWMSELQDKCSLFSAIINGGVEGGFQNPQASSAVEAFLGLVDKVVPTVANHLHSRLDTIAKMFDGASSIQTSTSGWTSLSDADSKCLQEHLSSFCTKSGIFILLQQLAAARCIPEALGTELERCRAFIQYVPGFCHPGSPSLGPQAL